MDRLWTSRSAQTAKVLLERCESGRIGLTANELTWVTGSEGSNPSLSARESGTWCRTIRMVARSGGPAEAPSPRRDPAWCEECVTSWASTGCRPWGVRRTRSTPTSWRAISLHRDTGRAPDAEAADLVVVNTCAFIDAARQESIDTVLTLADRRQPGRPPGRDRLHGRALRRRVARRPARGRPRGRLRCRAHGSPHGAVRADAVPVTLTAGRRAARAGAGHERVRPPGAAASGRPRPLGLRQGGRGVRPHLRLLRHPVVPGQAALPLARGGPGRGRRAARARRRRAAPARDRPRRPGPRLLRARPFGAGPAHPHRRRPVAHRRAHPRRVGPGGAHPPALPLSLRA